MIIVSLVLLLFSNADNSHQWKKDNHAMAKASVSRDMTAIFAGVQLSIVERSNAASPAIRAFSPLKIKESTDTARAGLQLDRQLHVRQRCDSFPPFIFRFNPAPPSGDEVPVLS